MLISELVSIVTVTKQHLKYIVQMVSMVTFFLVTVTRQTLNMLLCRNCLHGDSFYQRIVCKTVSIVMVTMFEFRCLNQW